MKKSGKDKTQIRQLTEKAKAVVRDYKKQYPDVKMGRDYLPLKITSEEFADMFAYLLVFADSEGVDVVESLTKKWFVYLKNKK